MAEDKKYHSLLTIEQDEHNGMYQQDLWTKQSEWTNGEKAN